ASIPSTRRSGTTPTCTRCSSTTAAAATATSTRRTGCATTWSASSAARTTCSSARPTTRSGRCAWRRATSCSSGCGRPSSGADSAAAARLEVLPEADAVTLGVLDLDLDHVVVGHARADEHGAAGGLDGLPLGLDVVDAQVEVPRPLGAEHEVVAVAVHHGEGGRIAPERGLLVAEHADVEVGGAPEVLDDDERHDGAGPARHARHVTPDDMLPPWPRPGSWSSLARTRA